MVLEDNDSLPKSLVNFLCLENASWRCQVIDTTGCYQTITWFLCQMGLLDELGTPGVWTLDGSKVFFSLNVCITCFLCPLKRQWYLGFLSDPDGKLLLKGVVMRLSKICFLLRKDHLALAFGAGCSWRFLIQGLNFCKEWITRSQKNDAKSI